MLDFLKAETLTEADVRDPETLGRIIGLVRRVSDNLFRKAIEHGRGDSRAVFHGSAEAAVQSAPRIQASVHECRRWFAIIGEDRHLARQNASFTEHIQCAAPRAVL